MKTENNQNTNQGHEANTLLAVSGPIEARIKYLAQTEREELDMLDNVAVGSLERQAKWMLIRELGARKSEAQFLLKEIQAACASGAVDTATCGVDDNGWQCKMTTEQGGVASQCMNGCVLARNSCEG